MNKPIIIYIKEKKMRIIQILNDNFKTLIGAIIIFSDRNDIIVRFFFIRFT